MFRRPRGPTARGRAARFRPIRLLKQSFWNRQVPQRTKSTDKDVVDELLTRQDSVIAELDKLESEILQAIDAHNASRQEQPSEHDASTAALPQTIRMPHADPSADDQVDNGEQVDQSSQAA